MKKGKKGLYATLGINLKGLIGAACIGACIALGGAVVLAAGQATAQEGVEIPVVMYHSVLKDEARHGKYVISPAEFENDLAYLKKAGYTTILTADLISYTKGGALPEKPILLTFDDGYYNNYLYAYEIAKRYKCKFVISPIGYYADLYTDTPDENAYYSHATWAQLREMVESGLVEVENHSYNLHKSSGRLGVKKLSGESEESYKAMLTEDLTLAQERITAGVGKTPVAFVYPFGAVSYCTPEIIKELGFSLTLSCEEKVSVITKDPESLYDLGRFLRESGVGSKEFFEKRMKLSSEVKTGGGA